MIVFLALSLVSIVRAQSIAPAKHTAFIEQYAATYRFSLGRPASVRVAPDGESVLFLRSGPRSFVRDLYVWDAKTKQERVLLTADQVLKGAQENLSAEELARRERARSAARGIASYDLSSDGKRLLVPLASRLFVVERESGKISEQAAAAGAIIDPRFSRDGARVAYVRDNELYAIEVGSPVEKRLTVDASSTVSNGLAEFAAQEEMDRFEGYWWSPDGKTIAYEQADTAGLEQFHIADLKRPEAEPRTWPYPRAGKTNARVRLGLIPSSGGETTWVTWDRDAYPYLAKVVWEKDAPLTILVQNRRQTEEALLAVAADGSTKTLLKEKDAAWINIDPSVPRWLPGGKGFLWSSERDGNWRLELRGRDGALIRTLTEGTLGYRSLEGVDASGQEAYIEAGPEPIENHVYRVSLDGARVEPVTRTPGQHFASFPDSGTAAYVLSSFGADGSRRQSVHQGASELSELRSVAEQPSLVPRIEFTTVGKRALRAAIIRPADFDASKKYPVVVQVYGGPHHNSVTMAGSRYLLEQWLAEQGFIVVSLDGRGTPRRGRDWERAIKGNFIRAALEDQADGLKELGAKYKEIDLSKVGIYGWSFGGYFSALAAMLRPDVFHSAVAGAPVADWRDYDTHYTERYMGLPEENKTGYDDSSALIHAAELTRPLLLIHGTTDDNVYFMHSLKLSDALFRAGKKHEFLPLVGFTHMVPDPVVTTRLDSAIADFLRRSLAP